MTYTEEAKQELSRKVAEKYGITAPKFDFEGGLGQIDTDTYPKWLHDDWHTLCEECNKRKIYARYSRDGLRIVAMVAADTLQDLASVEIADCASPSEAERIARLLALGGGGGVNRYEFEAELRSHIKSLLPYNYKGEKCRKNEAKTMARAWMEGWPLNSSGNPKEDAEFMFSTEY